MSNIELKIQARDEASAALQDVRNEIRGMQKQASELQQQQMSGNKTTEQSTLGLGKQAISLAKLSAGFFVAAKAAKEGYQYLKEGADLNLTATRFDRLSTSIGTTSDALLGRLRTATRGLYSDTELMSTSTDMMSLGLAKTSDEAVRLATVSAGLNMNMQQLVLTLTNKTTARFDSLGIKVDGFKEKVKQLTDTGMDADAAFKEAFLQQAEAQLQLVGNAADTSAGQLQMFEASWANLVNGLKMGTATALGPAIGSLASSLQTYNDAQRILEMYKTQSGQYTAPTSGMAALGVDRAYNQQLQAEAESWYQRQQLTQQITAQEIQGGRARYTPNAMPTYTPDYSAIITSGTALTTINQKIIDQQNKINQAFQDGSISAEDQAAALDDLGQQAGDAYDSMLSKILEQKGATDEVKAAFALATGQITQGAANQAQAIDAIAQALQDGSLTAQQAAQNVDTLMQMIQGMDGQRAALTIDLFVQQHGQIPGIFAQSSQHDQHLEDFLTGPGHTYAGGPIDPNRLTIVGDAPGGGLTPYSEVIVDGRYVLDAKTTQKLAKSGLLGGAASHYVAGPLGGAPIGTGTTSYTGGGHKNSGYTSPVSTPLSTASTSTISQIPEVSNASVVLAVENLTMQQHVLQRTIEQNNAEAKRTNAILSSIDTKTTSKDGFVNALQEAQYRTG